MKSRNFELKRRMITTTLIVLCFYKFLSKLLGSVNMINQTKFWYKRNHIKGATKIVLFDLLKLITILTGHNKDIAQLLLLW